MSITVDNQSSILQDDLTRFCILHNIPLVTKYGDGYLPFGVGVTLQCPECNPQIISEKK